MPNKPQDNRAKRNELRIAARLEARAKQNRPKVEDNEDLARSPASQRRAPMAPNGLEQPNKPAMPGSTTTIERRNNTENSDESRYRQLKQEAWVISQDIMNVLRYTTIPKAKGALQIAQARLQGVRDNAPFSITLPTWFKQAKKITPAGLGLEIGGIIGNVIVGKGNEKRVFSHKEQVSLWEKYVERMQEKIEDLEAKDRASVKRLKEISREIQGLQYRPRKNR